MDFKEQGESIVVAVPILEVYLPEDYPTTGLYSMVGNNTKWYGIANYKVFRKESELEHRELVPTRPLGICTFILSRPSETDIDDIQFMKGGEVRRSVILRFYMNDLFCVDRNVVKESDNFVVMMNRLENGKLDNIPPSIVRDVIKFGEKLNNISLKLPDEHLDALIAERYRDPHNHNRKLRFAGSQEGDRVVSITPREEAMTSTTFQGFTFEDVNSSIIVSCNRTEAGIKDDATIMERIVRGDKIDESETRVD